MKNRYYYLLIIGHSVSNFIIYFPYILLRNPFDGMLIALILGLIVELMASSCIAALCNKYKQYNLVDISKRVLGNFMGSVVLIIYILINFIMVCFIFSAFTFTMRKFLLPKSPTMVSAALIIIPVIFIIKMEVRNFLILSGVITLSNLLGIIIIIFSSLSKVDFNSIGGAIVHSFKTPKIPMIMASAFFFSGSSYILTFNPEFQHINKKGIYKPLILICLPIALVAILLPIGTWGPVLASQLIYVQMATLDTLYTDFFIIERVVYILMPFLFSFGVNMISNYCYNCYTLLKTLGIPKNILNIIVITSYGFMFLFCSFVKGTTLFSDLVITSGAILLVIKYVITFSLYTVMKIRG